MKTPGGELRRLAPVPDGGRDGPGLFQNVTDESEMQTVVRPGQIKVPDKRLCHNVLVLMLVYSRMCRDTFPVHRYKYTFFPYRRQRAGRFIGSGRVFSSEMQFRGSVRGTVLFKIVVWGFCSAEISSE